MLADNGLSTHRLVYDHEPATVIAVGGNTLSRGLTLEGLVSSYFLRSSNTYDTLLQMGRWFGYRPGYGDLPRIWTTQQLADDFEFLSEIEDALRTEITRYRTMDSATPANLPVRIGLHPRMQATARVKMHFAIRGEASYSAQRPQTTYFAHRDPKAIDANLKAGRTLLKAAKQAGAVEDVQDSRVVLCDVPVESIRDFVRGYSFHADSEMTSDLLLKYIDGQVRCGALQSWNIAVMGIQKPDNTVPLGLDAESALITRSKLERPSTANRAVIGTLMSKPDRVADLLPAASVTATITDDELQAIRDEDGRGLLVLYPIDRKSKPKTGTNGRVALDAVGELLGAAFCFPTAAPNSEAADTIQVDVSGIQLSDDEDFPAYEDLEGSQDDVDLDHD